MSDGAAMEYPAGPTHWMQRDGVTGAGPSSRRILLLTTTYPPRTEVGAARWEGFTPLLVRAGWGVDAIIEQPSQPEPPDWGRLSRLPADVRVAAIAVGLPWWHATLMRARAQFRGIPRATDNVSTRDPGPALWTSGLKVRQALSAAVYAARSRQGVDELAAAATALAEDRHRIVVSSGPPHYVHIAAARLARQRHIPHVIDLRDPWGREATPVGERWFPDQQLRRSERPTLERASLIITNTIAAQRVLQGRFPALRDRILCMPNGSDLDPIDASTLPQRARFCIAHCGSLYLDRDPRPFLRAAGRVRERLSLGPDDLRVVFMGAPTRVAGRSLDELAAEAGLAGVFEERPAGTRDEARQLLRESSMAVAFQGETRTQIPAKVFEYVAFPLWLLALVGAESATADVLANSDAIVLDLDDEAGAAESIETCYKRFRAGDLARPVGWDGRFSRARQAERLVVELERLETDAVRRRSTG
ncbi:MAG TPA: hypothetical protein VF461_07800 [Gemmatimonadaceae bacterium]